MAIGSDVDFFGFGGGGGYGGGYLPSLLQPWMNQGQGGQSPYVGYSSFIPQTSVIPATAQGFVEQYIPELGYLENLGGQLGSEVKDLFKEFRFGGNASAPGAAQSFADTLLQREDIQGLLERTQLQEEGAFLRSQNVQDATSLADVVTAGLEDPESQLQNLYGTTGFKQEQITEDIRRFASGESSGLGNLSSESMFGARGKHTDASRQAILAQLLGGQGGAGLVDIGGGQAFNPYSYDILSEEYRFGGGLSGDISGHNVLTLGGGVLATQDADITADVAGALSGAQLGGDANARGFGGYRGYRLAQGLQNIQGLLGEEDFAIQQGGLAGSIDQWYQGLVGKSDFRGLPDQFANVARGGAYQTLKDRGVSDRENMYTGALSLGHAGGHGASGILSGGLSAIF